MHILCRLQRTLVEQEILRGAREKVQPAWTGFLQEGRISAMFCDQKQFLSDSVTGPRKHGGHARRVGCWYAQMFPLISTSVWPQYTGSSSPGAHLRILPLGPSALHTALFDSDGSWKPGDIRSCNNINALRQVFKSGTCLIIITTFALFILLQRGKSLWCFLDSFVFSPFPFLPPSFLSSFSCSGGKRKECSLGRGTGWEQGGRMVGVAVICKSFIYVWHLHNEAGSQWQPWLAGDRVACLQF